MDFLSSIYSRSMGCFRKFPLEKLEEKLAALFHGSSREEQGASTSMAIPQPPDDVVEKSFRHFVHELDLSEENQARLMQLPIQTKWKMLCEQEQRMDDCATNQPPEYYVQILRNIRADPMLYKSNKSQLEALRMALRTQSLSYVQLFITTGGLQQIEDLLELTVRRFAQHELAFALLACIKALLNSSHGRHSVINSSRTFNVLILTSSVDWAKCKILCLEILSGLCLLPESGHEKVLQAASEVSPSLGERCRFQRLVTDLWRVYSPSEDCRIKVAILSFINVLLRTGYAQVVAWAAATRKHLSALPTDHCSKQFKNCLEFRLHLRFEFLSLGMQQTLEELRSMDNPILNDHIDLFEMMRQEDEEKWLIDLEPASNIESCRPDHLLELLILRLGPSEAMSHLQSILLHFMLIPGDQNNSELWRLFDMMSQQLTLKVAKPPAIDPAADLLHSFNMNTLLDRLHKESDYERLEKAHADIQLRMMTLEEELQREREKCESFERRSSNIDANSVSSDSTNFSTASSSGVSSNLPSPTCSGSGSGSGGSGSSPIPAPQIPAPPPPPPLPPPLNGFNMKQIHATIGATPVRPCIPKPGQSLKCFNWKKLDKNQIDGTIWSGIEDELIYPLLDVTNLEHIFAISSGKTDESDIYGTIRGSVDTSVVERQRAQNCTIVLSSLKMTNQQMKDVLINMDTNDCLERDLLQQLLKFIPTPIEIEQLREAASSIELINPADDFMLQMSDIPRYEQRLECLVWKKSLEDRVQEAQAQINTVIRACRLLPSCTSFKRLLSVILAIGNCLNYGKHSCNAFGFSLNSLDALVQVKSSVKADYTLMHFLVEFVERRLPDLLTIGTQLSMTSQAAKINGPDLDQEVKWIRKGLELAESELHLLNQTKWQAVLHPNDQFVPVMIQFTQDVSPMVKDLTNRHQEMKLTLHSCLRCFGCEQTKPSPDIFFSIVSRFIEQFSSVHKQLRQRLVEEERRQKTIARTRNLTVKCRRKAALDSTRTFSANTFSNYSNNSDAKDGDFDQLILALQSGELFNRDLTRLRASFRKGSPKKSNSNNQLSIAIDETHIGPMPMKIKGRKQRSNKKKLQDQQAIIDIGPDLDQEVKWIRKGLELAESELHLLNQTKWQAVLHPNDQFVPVMIQFTQDVSPMVKDLTNRHQEMKLTLHSCLRCFGCEQTKPSPDIFFSIVSRFIEQFSSVHKQLRQRLVEEERRQKTIARTRNLTVKCRRKAALDSTRTFSANTFSNYSNNSDAKDGDFDQLILALQSGELFNRDLTRLRASFRKGSPKKSNSNNQLSIAIDETHIAPMPMTIKGRKQRSNKKKLQDQQAIIDMSRERQH